MQTADCDMLAQRWLFIFMHASMGRVDLMVMIWSVLPLIMLKSSEAFFLARELETSL